MTLLRLLDGKKKKWVFARSAIGFVGLTAWPTQGHLEKYNEKNPDRQYIKLEHGVYRTRFTIQSIGSTSKYVARMSAIDIENPEMPMEFDIESIAVRKLFAHINMSKANAAEINVAPGVFEAHIVFEKVGDTLQATLFDHNDPKADPNAPSQSN